MRPTPLNLSEVRIEELFRLTGARPAIPAERADRVRAAVRAHWRAETGRRSRGWTIGAVAALAAAVTVVVAIELWQRTELLPKHASVARIEAVVGSVWMQPASAGSTGSPRSIRPGDDVTLGSDLVTERNGRIAMRMASGHSVRLDGGTRLGIVSARSLKLDRGAVYVDSARPGRPAAESVEIRTPFGSVRDLGTQFEVRLLDSSALVRVREGRVSLDRGTSALEVGAGHEVEVDAEGRMHSRKLDVLGAEWQWIGEITPPMKIEGRSLREFLDWIVRERGLQLRFASPDLDSIASKITLNGSIDGMTLDQALDSVLPTCRMTHRIERNVLLVLPLADALPST